MRRRMALSGMVLAMVWVGQAAAQPYPGRAVIAQYRMARDVEIATARSAAPPAVADKASVMVLGERGYETAAVGTNGFVCMVQRGWANDLDHSDFWNPKVRGPICFNAAAAETVLPAYLRRTEWVLAGLSRDEIARRIEAGPAASAPAVGAMCFMMSKLGYLGDDSGGPWRPHLMYFLPPTEAASWGANLPGSPVFGGEGGPLRERLTVFITPVARWSDGSLDETLGGAGHRHDGSAS